MGNQLKAAFNHFLKWCKDNNTADPSIDGFTRERLSVKKTAYPELKCKAADSGLVVPYPQSDPNVGACDFLLGRLALICT